jgi:hypothetical protein
MVLYYRLRAPLLAAMLAGAVPPVAAHACAFHTDLPEASLSQRIADSVTLIAARPAPDDPFRFAPVRLLKGAPASSPPPQLVDAATRRRLAAAPDQAILFARDPDGSWARLLLIDETTRPVVAWMVAQAQRPDAANAAVARRDFAATLLSYPDPRLHRLALQELDALDYATLRGGTYSAGPADLIRGIADLQEQAYVPIRILLLGLVGGDAAEGEIFRQLDRRVRSGIATDFAAWTTAAIELRGAKGLARLERVMVASDRAPTPDQTAEFVRALAVQSASGDPDLRIPIRSALLRLVERQPDAAALIPPALSAASDRAQTGLVRDLVAARAFTSRADLLAATAYLSGAGNVDGRMSSPAAERFGHLTRPRTDRGVEPGVP